MVHKTPVLVVGAGPCGLAAACALWRHGIPARLLEANAEPNRGSRAIQLWPLALDVLADLGVLAEADERGIRVRAMNYHLSGGRRLRSVVGAVNEPLLLPQEQTSQILERELERLGGRVERSMRVSDVDMTGTGVTVKAHGPHGTELIEADWIIAADGVRSTVRDLLGVDFPGGALPTTFLLAEGSVEGDFERGSVHYFLGPAGSMVLAPLPGDVVRVAGPVPEDTELTLAAVQRMVDARGGAGLRIASLDTIATFGSQERIAAALRQDRAFLVGDAAHTHSPLGGQGLNLGLQDVHNLAWKLAGVIGGRFDPAILDSYDAERRQAAEQTVRNTHQFARMFMLKPAAARVRNAAWRFLEATGTLRRWFVPLLAGHRTRYPDALFPADIPRRPEARTARSLPRPGERTPRWATTPGDTPPGAAKPAAATPGGTEFRLLTTGAAGTELYRRAGTVAEHLPAMVTHEHLARREAGFLLLRPDGYVAASGRTPADLGHVHRLLDSLAPRR